VFWLLPQAHDAFVALWHELQNFVVVETKLWPSEHKFHSPYYRGYGDFLCAASAATRTYL